MRRAVVAAALILPLVAQAAPAAADTASVLACTAIRDASARLACFDRTVPSLGPATLGGAPSADTPRVQGPGAAPAVAAAAPPAAPREQTFGAERLPEQRAAEEARREEDVLYAAIRSIQETAGNNYRVELDNGQVWQTKQNRAVKLKAGEKVEVQRAMLGSYALILPDRNLFLRAERVK